VDASREIVHQFPLYMETVHTTLPAPVRKAAIEAEKCFAVGALNAAGSMARRAVDALAQDKGGKGKTLYERLADLKTKGIITPDLWEWAEELRVAGRSGAHPEWEELSAEETDYAVRFLREIIRFVYINPHERASRRLKESKKKTGKPSPPSVPHIE